jgi:hypothetical protein
MTPKTRFKKEGLYAALAAVIPLLWQFTVVQVLYDANWTALFYVGNVFPTPPDLGATTYIFPHTGYDGQFYRLAAHDPFFEKGYWKSVDDPRFRYRRILVPLAAHLSAAGRTDWIDGSYILVVAASLFLGTFWSSRYLAEQGCNPAWGLIFLLSPAALTSVDRMLVDATLLAMFAGFLLYSARRSWTGLYVVSMLSALTRETGLLLIAAPVAAFLLERNLRKAAWLATSTFPALAWYAFVSKNTPSSGALAILDWPVIGIFRRIFTARMLPGELPSVEVAVQVLDVAAIAGFLACLYLGIRWAHQDRNRSAAFSAFLFAGLGLTFCSDSYMLESYAWARPVSPLLLYVSVRCCVQAWFAALAAPLLVSVNVALTFVKPAYRVFSAVVLDRLL